MPGLITPTVNFSPTERLQIADITQLYTYVGNALTRRYETNRQAALNNVYNPLSQVKARDKDRALLNDIESDITAQLDEFRESDQWFDADQAVFNATNDILNNKGLRVIQESYAAEQQYEQGLAESGWDSATQTYFKLTSKEQSGAIQYDKEKNEVLGGGFSGINYGEPYDVAGYMEKVAKLASDIPASGSELQRVITDPQSNIIRGIASMTGESGESIVSMFTQVANSSEGVSRERVMSLVQTMLMNNPELINHKSTIAKRDLFFQRYQKDDNNENGFTLRDLTPNDLASLYAGNEVQYALTGLGLNLNNIVTATKDGGYKLQNNINPNDQRVIATIEDTTGINIGKLLTDTNYASSLSEEQGQILQSLLQKGYDDYVMSDYAKTSGGQDFNTWAENKYVNNTVQGDLLQATNFLANTYSWQKTSSKESLVANNAWASLWKARQKAKEDTQSLISGGVLSTGVISSGVNMNNIASNMQAADDISSRIITNQNALKDINVTDVMGKLGLSNEDLNDYTKLAQFANSSPTLTDDERERIMTYASLKASIDYDTAQLADITNIADQAKDIYHRNPDKAKGWGYYGVADQRAINILDNDLDSYSKYVPWQKRNEAESIVASYKDNYTETDVQEMINALDSTNGWTTVLDESKYKDIRNNAYENVIKRHNKQNPGKEVEIVTPGTTYSNADPTIKAISDAVKWELANGTNTGWTIKYTPNGEGVGTSASMLQRFVSANTFNPTAQGGLTVRGKAEGVDMSEFGIDEPVYEVEVLIGDTNVEQSGSNNMTATLVCKGINNNNLGQIHLERPADKQTLLSLATHSIGTNNDVIRNTPENNPLRDVAKQNGVKAGKTIAYHCVSFDTDSKSNIKIQDLELDLVNKEAKANPNDITNGFTYITTAMPIRNPYSEGVLTTIPVRIGKKIGEDKYTFEALNIDPTTKRAVVNNSTGSEPTYRLDVPLQNGQTLPIVIPEIAPSYVQPNGQPVMFNSISDAAGAMMYRITTGLENAISIDNRYINAINGAQLIR